MSDRENQEQTIRVDIKRLDNLMNLIGELVLAKNRLIKINSDVEERYEGELFLDELNQVVSIVSIVTSDLQIAVMKTRMLPIGKVFNKFPRMIRDLSRELNKNIELEIKGEETELDKSIIEVIGDPLVHIIRNSCDHGIDKKGIISLKAYNEGNEIIIQIKDDGRGLDKEKIIDKAIENKLITEKEADSLSDKEAYNLIFKPGLSTAEKVSNVSGRGVGMDVVKTNLDKLNAILEVSSKKNKGTSIKMKIPLTLAIIQALLVQTQEEIYAIPLSSVVETVKVSEDEVYKIDGKPVIKLRNDVLSLVYLVDLFNVEKTIANNNEELYIVVLSIGSSKLGIIVDTLIGQEEIVIKSMGEYLKGIKGISGATIRGDGGVTLIVDVAKIMELSKNIKITNKTEKNILKKKEKPSDYNILVIDDSKTDRTIIKQAISPSGMTVTEAKDGQEALEILKEENIIFDILLIDIEMPRMDGYTLAENIRKYSKYKNLPLIAVTSRTGKSDRMRGVEVGMTEYITKPYSKDYLLSIVKKNINFNEEL